MKVAIIKERGDHEPRVAASPESAKKLTGLCLGVVVESGAGLRARFSDSQYRDAGAEVAADADAALAGADVLLSVQRPLRESVAGLRRGALLIGQLAPHGDRGDIEHYA